MVVKGYHCFCILNLIDLIFIRDSITLRTGLKMFIKTLFQSLLKSIHISNREFKIKALASSTCKQYFQNAVDQCSHVIDIDRILFIPNKLRLEISLENATWVSITSILPPPANSTIFSDATKFICQILFYDEEKPSDHNHYLLNNLLTTSVIPLILTSAAEYNMRTICGLSQLLVRENLEKFRLTPILSDPNPKVNVSCSARYFLPMKASLLELTPFKSTHAISELESDINLNIHFWNERYLSFGNIVSLESKNKSTAQIRQSVTLDLLVTKIKNTTDEKSEHPQNQLFTVSSKYTKLFVKSTDTINAYHIREICPNFIYPVLLKYSVNFFNILKLGVKSSSSNLGSSILMSGGCGSGLQLICHGIAKLMGVNLYTVNMVNLIGDTSAYTEAKLKNLSQQINLNLPCLLIMKNIHSFLLKGCHRSVELTQLVGKDKEGHDDKRVILAFRDFLSECQSYRRNAREDKKLNPFIIGVSYHLEKVSPSLIYSFHHHIRVSQIMSSTCINTTRYEKENTAENTNKRTSQDVKMLNLIDWIAMSYDIEYDVEDISNWIMTSDLSRKPSLKEFDDILTLVAAAVRKAYEESEQNEKNILSASLYEKEEGKNCGRKCLKKVMLNKSHLMETLDEVESGFHFEVNNRMEIGKIPQVSWEDIGGLSEVKSELINSIQLPLQFPHFFQSGLMRSGILMYGPPGTGKTLVAKAVATEFKLSFMSVKGSELLNMYVGQSEQNVREVFQNARALAPCLVFFDELDALAPNRGRSGDSGGVMDRVVSQILAEMDGTHSSPSVFILGATNRPDLIDPALLRPGRFDKLLYIGVSSDKNTRKKILQALTRKFKLSSDVDLDDISKRLLNGMTGADLSYFCSNAYIAAAERRISLLESGNSKDADTPIYVSQEDFDKAISQITVSLTHKDISNYENLRHMTR